MPKPNFPFSGPISQGRFAICDESDTSKQLQVVLTDLTTGKQLVLYGKDVGSLQLGSGATPAGPPAGSKSFFISGPSGTGETGEIGIGIRAEAPAGAASAEVVEAAIVGYNEVGAGELSIYTADTSHPVSFYIGGSSASLTVGATLVTSVVPLQLPSYGVSGVPDAAVMVGSMIYVTDDVGGSIPAFSDGVNWLRVTDRAVISL